MNQFGDLLKRGATTSLFFWDTLRETNHRGQFYGGNRVEYQHMIFMLYILDCLSCNMLSSPYVPCMVYLPTFG